MKLPLKEPMSPRYIYISPNNVVHLFMPVVSGSSIGLDNTCKSVYGLQEFFGIGGNVNDKNSVKKTLLDYKDALKDDLSWTELDKTTADPKTERLKQIDTYLKILEPLEQSQELDTLKTSFPSYPRPLEMMLQDKALSNLHSIILRPTTQDPYIRSEASSPLFSVAHDSESRDRWHTSSSLQQVLMSTYSGLTFQQQNVTAQLIKRVMTRLEKSGPSDFELLKKILHEETKDLIGESIDFNQDAKGKLIDKARLNQEMLFDASTTPEEYIDALLGYCAQELIETHIDSPFNYLTQAEQWSIATQFLLGITSLYCVSQSKMSSDLNWGKLLEEHQKLRGSLAKAMKQAQQNKQSPEDHLVNWINERSSLLGLNTPLSVEDLKTIKKEFAQRYVQIKDSPHFDEFFLLDTSKKGSFVVHQGSICASFADFAASPLFDLPPEYVFSLEVFCKDFNTLDGVEIPHQNPWVQASVDLDLSHMDNKALQALYDQINTYKDFEKKVLLKQLAQERPDFKPQVDAKAFLQHVAYGQQDEAETLLKNDSDLAQELLLEQKTPFTDYSGRTFTCSAYEYAYWAKDTHMCRMLEKYMNMDTRAETLKRVQFMEELIGPEFFQKARGLTYMQKGKAYRSAHFDLKPLINALQHYIEEYDSRRKMSEADEQALNKIWIEEVGRAQREVPAHIAQEYSHPDRLFKDVSNNKSLLDASNPNNLKRQLKFYNPWTSTYDAWFTHDSHAVDSGLGFSFAIVRGHRASEAGAALEPWSSSAGRDLAALTAIDEVRSSDLKQSLDNLSRPLSVHAASLTTFSQ